MISNMERIIFACDHSMQQSSVRLHGIYIKIKEGGVAVNLRSELGY